MTAFLAARKAAKVPCPRCFAPAGQPCRSGRLILNDFHDKRIDAGDRAATDRRNAAKRRSRGSVSINGEIFAAFKRRAESMGESTDDVAERLVTAWLDQAGAP